MADSWVTKQASDVRIGDRVRSRDRELTVHRIEENFLGRDGFLAFIEDSPERWFKVPVASTAEVDVNEPNTERNSKNPRRRASGGVTRRRGRSRTGALIGLLLRSK